MLVKDNGLLWFGNTHGLSVGQIGSFHGEGVILIGGFYCLGVSPQKISILLSAGLVRISSA